MECTVRAYINTGFSNTDIPSSPDVLSGDFEYRDYPRVNLRQDYDLQTLNIEARWDDIKDCDYIRLQLYSTESRVPTRYYVVNDVVMISTKTAQLTITLDPLNSSGGISSIQVISGWTERLMVSEDTFGYWNATEDFVPSEPMVVHKAEIFFTKSAEPHTFAASTVNLVDLGDTADDYVSGNGLIVTVPSIPSVNFTGVYNMALYQSSRSKLLPNTWLFDLTDTTVQRGVRQVRSLGIEGAIVDTFAIDKDWTSYEAIPGNPVTAGLSSVTRYFQAGGPEFSYNYSYGTILNNKSFSGQFNKYTLVSLVTGDAITFDMEDLYMGGTSMTPTVAGFADPSPGGRPYARFNRVRGIPWDENPFQDCVQGATWEKVPITYTTQASQYQADIRQKYSNTRRTISLIQNFASGAVNAFSYDKSGQITGPNPGGAIGNVFNAANQLNDIGENVSNYMVNRYIVEPQTYFPNDPSLQQYFGNAFVLIKTGLSHQDRTRFDTYLNMYGYRIEVDFRIEQLSTRQNFNFIKTNNANVRGTMGLRINRQINAMFDNGIRLWHKKPEVGMLTSENPPRT